MDAAGDEAGMTGDDSGRGGGRGVAGEVVWPGGGFTRPGALPSSCPGSSRTQWSKNGLRVCVRVCACVCEREREREEREKEREERERKEREKREKREKSERASERESERERESVRVSE